MDFWKTTGVIVRRWRVVLPVLILALLGTAAIYKTLPTQYVSNAVLVLTAPPTGSTTYSNGFRPNTVNPLLDSSNGIDITGTVLIQGMNTAEFQRRVGVPADGSVKLTVNNGTDNPELLTNGPFVLVSATAGAPGPAQALVTRVVQEAATLLRVQQAALGAPVGTDVRLLPAVAPTEAAAQQGNRLRTTGAALALGLFATLASAFAAESLPPRLRRLRRRGADPTAAGDTEEGGTEADDPARELVGSTAQPGDG
jgi:hypothetical protein